MFPDTTLFPIKFITSTINLESKLCPTNLSNNSMRLECKSFKGPGPEEIPPNTLRGIPAALILE